VGPQAGGWIVVGNGLKAGERIVHDGGFAIKALILKSKLGGE
jgi:multidrug efflux pump subunit AcrA (membrane-fusion protein)